MLLAMVTRFWIGMPRANQRETEKRPLEGSGFVWRVDRGLPSSLMYSCGVQVQRCEDFKVGGHHEEQGRKNRTNVIPEGTESVFSDTFGQGRGGAREREAEREERIVKSLKDVKQNM